MASLSTWGNMLSARLDPSRGTSIVLYMATSFLGYLSYLRLRHHRAQGRQGLGNILGLNAIVGHHSKAGRPRGQKLHTSYISPRHELIGSETVVCELEVDDVGLY